jgi:fatty acid-binding protein DegV
LYSGFIFAASINPNVKLIIQRKAIAQLLEIVQERLGEKKMAEAAVMDVNAPEEGDAVAEMVKGKFGPTGLHRTTVSPVVGTHVGPGTIGVAYYGDV